MTSGRDANIGGGQKPQDQLSKMVGAVPIAAQAEEAIEKNTNEYETRAATTAFVIIFALKFAFVAVNVITLLVVTLGPLCDDWTDTGRCSFSRNSSICNGVIFLVVWLTRGLKYAESSSRVALWSTQF